MTVVMKGCIGHQSVSGDVTNRERRVHLNLPVTFEYPGGTAAGQAIDISESGILVDFDQAMEVWTTGDLSVIGQLWHLHIEARVARVNGHQAAFAFRGISSRDRQMVDNLIKDVSTSNAKLQPKQPAVKTLPATPDTNPSIAPTPPPYGHS
jgi:hypothetical protein